MKSVLIIVGCVFYFQLFSSHKLALPELKNVTTDTVVLYNHENDLFEYASLHEVQKPNPVFTLFKKKQRLNKKITAAALAFPFPFGIVGLHRIYLGTKPYVPIAYIGTVGGVFGVLPLIDFIKISFDKDLSPYQNNGQVFMWIKD